MYRIGRCSERERSPEYGGKIASGNGDSAQLPLGRRPGHWPIRPRSSASFPPDRARGAPQTPVPGVVNVHGQRDSKEQQRLQRGCSFPCALDPKPGPDHAVQQAECTASGTTLLTIPTDRQSIAMLRGGRNRDSSFGANPPRLSPIGSGRPKIHCSRPLSRIRRAFAIGAGRHRKPPTLRISKQTVRYDGCRLMPR
jgi:hypothetical protein